MPFASSAFGQLRYIQEATQGVIPGAGNALNLRMLTPSLKASLATVKSQEIRADRLSTGQTRTDLDVDGGFNFELSAREYDPFFEGVLSSAYAHHGVGGLGAVFGATTAASTITAAVAPAGASAFTTLAVGSWFKVVPPVAATAAVRAYFANRWFRVLSTTATTITLDPSTPIVAPGLGITAAAGYAISQSTMSNGSVARSFAMEYLMTDISQVLTYTGMRPNTMEMSMEVGSIITGSFGFTGMGHTTQPATRLPGTPVASQPFEVMNSVTDVGAIYEGGQNILTGSTSFIKSVSLSINNNTRGQKAVGVFGNADVGLGELELTGNIEMYVENATYYNKWLQGTTSSLVLGVADSAGNGYLIEFDKINYTDGGMNPGGRADDTMLSLPFSAFFNAATNRGIRITRAIAA
jgi:hypothetical protein